MRSPLLYLSDAVLRAPTIGCMLMCLTASLVGVIVYLRKESLLGESLSHAAYPGIILGVMSAGVLVGSTIEESALTLMILCGAFVTSYLGLCLIAWLEERHRVRADSGLTLVLASFMGIGLTLASHIQFSQTILYRQAQNYLFGQAATMTDRHIYMYAVLALITISLIVLVYKELQAITFDRIFSKTVDLRVQLIDTLVYLLIVFAVILGIRSVGVVLMSAMFITPPIAARQFTQRFSRMLVIAGGVGIISGFLGNYLSVELSDLIEAHYPNVRLALPTGPMIILVSSTLCIIALLVAPERGLVRRYLRIAGFRYTCLCENVLKSMWRRGARQAQSFEQIAEYQDVPPIYLTFLLLRLRLGGWIVKMNDGRYRLTRDGRHRAQWIVRLHRLWEVYLTDQLGRGVERVHRSAEEMEHILTPDIEQQLTQLLDNPRKDPHQQPIPPRQSL